MCYNIIVKKQGRDPSRFTENYKTYKKGEKTMANYKKLETLVKNFESLTDDNLREIVHCDDVDVTTLSDREKFSCLVFDEMRKALATKTHTLLLDCNYPKSNKHHKSEAQLARGQSPEWLVDYYRLVTNDDAQKSLIQIYVSANPKNGTCKFSLCTSCAKANLEQFLSLRDELHFEPLKKKGGEGAKTTTRKGVDYTELVDVCKAVVAILANTEKAKAEAKKQVEEDEDTEE